MKKQNGALKRHHENIKRQQDIELAIIITASAALGTEFIGFGLIAAVVGV